MNTNGFYFALSGLRLVEGGRFLGRCPRLYYTCLSGSQHIRWLCIWVAWLLTGAMALGAPDPTSSPNTLPVGEIGTNLYSTPINQLLTPAGRQIELPGLRPQ